MLAHEGGVPVQPATTVGEVIGRLDSIIALACERGSVAEIIAVLS